jgi:hypothetical protein
MAQTLEVKYRPAHTVVRLLAKVEVHTGLAMAPAHVRTIDVRTATEADPRQEWTLELDGGFWDERTFDLHLGADQRLTGADYTSAGAGPRALEAGIRLATFAVKIAPLVAATSFLRAPGEEDDTITDVRDRFHELVATLQGALGDRVDAIGMENGATPAAAAALKATEAALTAARAEAAELDARYEAIRSARFPTVVEHIEYAIPTSALPELESDSAEITSDDLDLVGIAAEVANRLDVVVARVKDPGDQGGRPHTEKAGVHYRLPRRLRLAVYRAVDPPSASPAHRGHAAPRRYLLHKSTLAWVVDAKSELAFVGFESGVFGKHGTSVEFGDSGTLTHVSNSSASTAGITAQALSTAGGQVVDALGQADKIAKAFPDSPDPTEQTLEHQVKLKELEARLAKANRTISRGGATDSKAHGDAFVA